MKGVERGASAVDRYKEFIDLLVDHARSSVIANRIRQDGTSERQNQEALPYAPEERNRSDLFAALTIGQKEIVARLLEDERQSAIHDVASMLDGLQCSDSLDLTWRGQKLPQSPFASMHYDFVCRMEGDSWPDEREANA